MAGGVLRSARGGTQGRTALPRCCASCVRVAPDAAWLIMDLHAFHPHCWMAAFRCSASRRIGAHHYIRHPKTSIVCCACAPCSCFDARSTCTCAACPRCPCPTGSQYQVDVMAFITRGRFKAQDVNASPVPDSPAGSITDTEKLVGVVWDRESVCMCEIEMERALRCLMK